jgi:hypothetical protein
MRLIHEHQPDSRLAIFTLVLDSENVERELFPTLVISPPLIPRLIGLSAVDNFDKLLSMKNAPPYGARCQQGFI